MRTVQSARAALVIGFVLLSCSLTNSWGSLSPGETHQYIVRTAYARLKKDPAFARDLFPAQTTIEAHEGVQWAVTGLSGNGPDAKGMSKYAKHYYNPVTNDGDGPKAAAYYFEYLARQTDTPGDLTDARGKAAAWSAHFLADMFVPYHVIGMSRTEANSIWSIQTAKHPGVIELDLRKIGSYALSYATPIKGGSHNFDTELSRFVHSTDPDEADWFDPWYYNGNTEEMMVKSSSHIAWEAAPNYSAWTPPTSIAEYERRAGNGYDGYVPRWPNAAPTFDRPWERQADRVRDLAVRSAAETRTLIDTYVDDPTPALAEAVRTVYSMWRSSFSGLRPDFEFQLVGPHRYIVTPTIKNAASVAATSVQTRLSADGCTVSDKNPHLVAGAIAAVGGRAKAPSWDVTTTDAPCRVTLVVIGAYPIPDLQYASVTHTFSPTPAPPDKPEPATTPRVSPPPGVPATSAPPDASGGAWVLEKTEFVVEKVDAAFMQRSQPTESGADGSGSATSTSQGPPVTSWRMNIAWTPPPRVLVPGAEVAFTVTVSDAGSTANGSGFGSFGANCPSLHHVWAGPAAGFDLKAGVRSKAASKTYTPPKAKPGTVLYLIADYGVFSRRQQFIYTYKLTLDPAHAPAAVVGSASPTPPPLAEVTVLDTMNGYAVGNQPTAPATFTLRQAHEITSIMTYHWNDGRGTRAGTITLRDERGRSYGPWVVRGTAGQGGVPNAAWTCTPGVEVPAGTYTVVDSEPATWSQNTQSGGVGMTVVKGRPKS